MSCQHAHSQLCHLIWNGESKLMSNSIKFLHWKLVKRRIFNFIKVHKLVFLMKNLYF